MVGMELRIANSVAPHPVCFLLNKQFAGIFVRKFDKEVAPAGTSIVQFWFVFIFINVLLLIVSLYLKSSVAIIFHIF